MFAGTYINVNFQLWALIYRRVQGRKWWTEGKQGRRIRHEAQRRFFKCTWLQTHLGLIGFLPIS